MDLTTYTIGIESMLSLAKNLMFFAFNIHHALDNLKYKKFMICLYNNIGNQFCSQNLRCNFKVSGGFRNFSTRGTAGALQMLYTKHIYILVYFFWW